MTKKRERHEVRACMQISRIVINSCRSSSSSSILSRPEFGSKRPSLEKEDEENDGDGDDEDEDNAIAIIIS